MTEYFRKQDDRDAVFEVVGDKGVTKVVDLGVVYAGDAKVAFNGCADIAHQKGLA